MKREWLIMSKKKGQKARIWGLVEGTRELVLKLAEFRGIKGAFLREVK